MPNFEQAYNCKCAGPTCINPILMSLSGRITTHSLLNLVVCLSFLFSVQRFHRNCHFDTFAIYLGLCQCTQHQYTKFYFITQSYFHRSRPKLSNDPLSKQLTLNYQSCQLSLSLLQKCLLEMCKYCRLTDHICRVYHTKSMSFVLLPRQALASSCAFSVLVKVRKVLIAACYNLEFAARAISNFSFLIRNPGILSTPDDIAQLSF